MSQHQEWKMIHLLYRYARRSQTGDRPVLTGQELTSAGVYCDPDSRQLLGNPVGDILFFFSKGGQ